MQHITRPCLPLSFLQCAPMSTPLTLCPAVFLSSPSANERQSCASRACSNKIQNGDISATETDWHICRQCYVAAVAWWVHTNTEQCRFKCLKVWKSTPCYSPFSVLTLLVGWQEEHPACKITGVLVRWWQHFDRSFARLIVPVVTTTTSITFSSNKIQNRDILVPANPGPPGKWPLKWTESMLTLWAGWQEGHLACKQSRTSSPWQFFLGDLRGTLT